MYFLKLNVLSYATMALALGYQKTTYVKKYLIGFKLLVPLLLQVPWILPQYLYIYLYLCNEYKYDSYKSVKSVLSSGDIESDSWIERRTLSS